jgi:DNA-binding GntR family transcriptional regulator
VRKIDPNDRHRRPFQQIADDLRSRIGRGEFAPGQPLPSIKALSGEYEVAGQTIQSALRVLKEENLVVSEPARGLYVRDPSEAESATDSADPAELAAVKSELRDLQERVMTIEEDNARLEAVIMDLYGRTGHSYPHKASKGATRREQSG